MRFPIILFILSVSTSAFAQLPYLEGEWSGTSKFLNKVYHVDMALEQSGSQLEGTVETRSLKGKDSTLFNVTGYILDGVIELIPEEFQYKTKGECLANYHLTLDENSNELTGKWQGDWKLNTCAPGIKGSVSLHRENAHESHQSAGALRNVEVQENAPVTDEMSLILQKVLKQRRYYALLIAVNDYADTSIGNLDEPIKDAENLRSILIQQYSFEPENVKVLKNPSRERIIETLDELSQEISVEDNLLVFYAGHGVWSKQLNQGYWLPTDAKKKSKSRWLSNSTLRDYLGGIPAKHTLLISDACFSGGILKERAVFEDGKALLQLHKLDSRKAMTSGTLTTVPDKSVFMKYLLKNLETNDRPMISAEELFRNFKIAVINNSPNGQVPQYGPITQTGDEGGDFIFAKRTK